MGKANTAVKRRWRERLFNQQCGLCYYCAKPMLLQHGVNKPTSCTLDHIIPLSIGGAPGPSKNAVAACGRCNSERGNSDARLFFLQKRGLA